MERLEPSEIRSASPVDGLWVVLAVRGKAQRFVTVLRVFRGLSAAEAYAHAKNDRAANVRGRHRYVVSSAIGEVVETKKETPTSLLGAFAEVREVHAFDLATRHGEQMSYRAADLPDPVPRGSKLFLALAPAAAKEE